MASIMKAQEKGKRLCQRRIGPQSVWVTFSCGKEKARMSSYRNKHCKKNLSLLAAKYIERYIDIDVAFFYVWSSAKENLSEGAYLR